MQVRWSHTVLKCRDLEAMIAFYCDLFGFEVSDRGEIGPLSDIVFLSGSSSDHHQLALVGGRGEETATSLDHNAFRVGALDDVRSVLDFVTHDDRVEKGGLPLSHGNAVSVYFSDPEGNGIEVFWDTPWHVKQPQARVWDPSLNNDEVLAWVESEFGDEPEFGPMEDYRAERARHFGEIAT